jgi:hypothetical protein
MMMMMMSWAREAARVCAPSVTAWMRVAEHQDAIAIQRASSASKELHYSGDWPNQVNGIIFQRHPCCWPQFWLQRNSEDCDREHIVVCLFFALQH